MALTGSIGKVAVICQAEAVAGLPTPCTSLHYCMSWWWPLGLPLVSSAADCGLSHTQFVGHHVTPSRDGVAGPTGSAAPSYGASSSRPQSSIVVSHARLACAADIFMSRRTTRYFTPHAVLSAGLQMRVYRTSAEHLFSLSAPLSTAASLTLKNLHP